MKYRYFTQILPLLFLLFVTSGNAQQVSGLKAFSANGVTVNTYDFNGIRELLEKTESDTTYVINFWATWCGPCIKELPHFEKISA
ncbi:MAG: hypothetical protein EOO01_33240, partial [Chitinophagaceae bacterium]